MSTEENKAIARRLLEQVKRMITTVYAGFSDLHQTLDDQIAEGIRS